MNAVMNAALLLGGRGHSWSMISMPKIWPRKIVEGVVVIEVAVVVVVVVVVVLPFSESVNLICGSAPLLLLMVRMMVRWLEDGHFHFSKNIFTMMESARKWERIFFFQISCVADIL